ncbi:hypothetical protein BDA96_02G191700 [Sorghum bicolor]|uniref:Uncharacterized protein n=2 Tax=Sorghum bicolor TaxID=4558 RepID=A0A921RMW6_SORBI|nr:hypothetical protein BDA96_02G191700 [Sorghum bicolor]KXG35487.1 hypothetical protein SORBI_3002G181500 [Sorghum bicolor]
MWFGGLQARISCNGGSITGAASVASSYPKCRFPFAMCVLSCSRLVLPGSAAKEGRGIWTWTRSDGDGVAVTWVRGRGTAAYAAAGSADRERRRTWPS